jgi:hypothetical protein
MSDFMNTDDELANINGTANEDDDLVLDLSEDDLSSGRKPLPVGTLLRLSVYDVDLTHVKKEGPNKGKPMYKFTLKVLGEGVGKGRQFDVYAPLWSGAFFTAFRIFRALGFETPKPPAAGERAQFKVPGKSKLLGGVLGAKVAKHEPGNMTDDDGNPVLFERLGSYMSVEKLEELVGQQENSSGLDEFASGDGGLFS